MVAIRTLHHGQSQVLASAFTRSLFSIQRPSCPFFLPSLRDDSLSLLSPSAYAFFLHRDAGRVPRECSNYSPLASICTVDWEFPSSPQARESPQQRLKACNIAHSGVLGHLLCVNERQCIRERIDPSIVRHRPLRSVDVDAIVKPLQREESPAMGILPLLQKKGMLQQPISIDEINSMTIAMTGKRINPNDVKTWLQQHHFRRIVTSAMGDPCEDIHGAVWIHEEAFSELIDPHQLVQQSIDGDRLRTLSDLWDHKQTQIETIPML